MKPIKIKKNYYKFSFDKFDDFWKTIVSTLSSDFDKKTDTEIFFHCQKILSIDQIINSEKEKRFKYQVALWFFYDLGNQLKDLEENNISIPFFDKSDIIVLDTPKRYRFLYVNRDKLLKINNGEIKIDTPYKNNGYFSPELEDVSILPSDITCKSGIFSLAAMCTALLNNKKITDEMRKRGFFWRTDTSCDFDHLSERVLLLDLIYGTKLYFALERCLDNSSGERYFFFI